VKVDVAIIGSGPGGALAAYELADSGLDVLVLEKQRLPRVKPCGGLMPGVVKQLTDCPLDQLIDHRVSRIDFSHHFKQPHSSLLGKHEALLTHRAIFDAGILEFAAKKSRGNLTIRDSVKLTDITERAGGITIHTGSEKIHARAVIAADGASSDTARHLGMQPPRKHPAAIDAEIEVSQAYYDQVCERLIFNYFYLPAGYGWIFPKSNRVLSCGVGSWGSARLPLKKIMANYISDSIPAGDIISMTQRGHPIPAYQGARTIASKRTCIVGDAAGLVDPVTGEGIRYALISGQLAAQTVEEYLLNQDSTQPDGLDCRAYQQRIQDAVGSTLDAIYRYRVLPFQQAPEYYYRKFILGGRGKGA
jgi:geranylgeranyl reductase family protein